MENISGRGQGQVLHRGDEAAQSPVCRASVSSPRFRSQNTGKPGWSAQTLDGAPSLACAKRPPLALPSCATEAAIQAPPPSRLAAIVR